MHANIEVCEEMYALCIHVHKYYIYIRVLIYMYIHVNTMEHSPTWNVNSRSDGLGILRILLT
jgi:hypothetical protein